MPPAGQPTHYVFTNLATPNVNWPGWLGSCWWCVQLDRGRCTPPAAGRWTGRPEEDPALQPRSPLVLWSWDLSTGASEAAPSFPRRIRAPAAPTADTTGTGPSHRVCTRKIKKTKSQANSISINLSIRWSKRRRLVTLWSSAGSWELRSISDENLCHVTRKC